MNDTNPAHAGGNPWTVVCGTGHRQLPPDQAEWMRGQLARCAVWLRDVAGTQVGISGFARGFEKQGSYIAGQMDEIAEANAPICTVHGPMADSDDPAIFQSHDGHRWHCAGRPGCTAAYWWIDGTCLRRATP